MNTRLYLLTNDSPIKELLYRLETILDINQDYHIINILQIRRKSVKNTNQLLSDCQKIVSLVQKYNIHNHNANQHNNIKKNTINIVINDYADIAKKLNQQFNTSVGVHLGQGDGGIKQARNALGQCAMIGKTCHNSIDFAKMAMQDGANYAAFGAMFASKTKPNATIADINTVIEALNLGFDICLIGGIHLDNAQNLLVNINYKKYTTKLYLAICYELMQCDVKQIHPIIKKWHELLVG